MATDLMSMISGRISSAIEKSSEKKAEEIRAAVVAAQAMLGSLTAHEAEGLIARMTGKPDGEGAPTEFEVSYARFHASAQTVFAMLGKPKEIKEPEDEGDEEGDDENDDEDDEPRVTRKATQPKLKAKAKRKAPKPKAKAKVKPFKPAPDHEGDGTDSEGEGLEDEDGDENDGA